MREIRFRKALRGVLAAVALALAAVAVAGSLGLDRLAARGPEPRLTRQPPLVFLHGTLQRSRVGGWALDDGTLLQQGPGLVWREETTGGTGNPAPGRQVRVTGQFRGQVLVVRHATLLPRSLETHQVLTPAQMPSRPVDSKLPR